MIFEDEPEVKEFIEEKEEIIENEEKEVDNNKIIEDDFEKDNFPIPMVRLNSNFIGVF